MPKIIDGAIQVQVNANLHVDEATFKACMSLIKIYATERDMTAMLVRFIPEEEHWLGYEVAGIRREDEMLHCPLCYQDIKREVQT